MRIVFMGTPEFAVASLKRLVEDGHEICGVFTQPDKPKNRGMKLVFPPVKEFALSQGLPVFQPESMKEESAVELLRSLKPELSVVAAYGQILPQEALQVPALGSINVHASLLPRYRGAAPINWAILNGESETGVTIMHMAKKLDAGDIIAVRRTPIDPNEDAEMLFARLAELGAQLLSETIPLIESGAATRTPQDEAQSTYAPMLSRALSPIDWKRPSRVILDQIRGLVPWPVASTVLDGKTLKIYQAQPCKATSELPGMMRAVKGGIEAACGDGQSILITFLQPEGGKRMSASAYLNGRRIAS
ncbi:MAG: methionyl-tRNA formyltransferase, partial [Oscillospiraceae bacterium]|nr:methionyl-tRNA formyltransferase [Oscillospiraceae bacterium]